MQFVLLLRWWWLYSTNHSKKTRFIAVGFIFVSYRFVLFSSCFIYYKVQCFHRIRSWFILISLFVFPVFHRRHLKTNRYNFFPALFFHFMLFFPLSPSLAHSNMIFHYERENFTNDYQLKRLSVCSFRRNVWQRELNITFRLIACEMKYYVHLFRIVFSRFHLQHARSFPHFSLSRYLFLIFSLVLVRFFFLS